MQKCVVSRSLNIWKLNIVLHYLLPKIKFCPYILIIFFTIKASEISLSVAILGSKKIAWSGALCLWSLFALRLWRRSRGQGEWQLFWPCWNIKTILLVCRLFSCFLADWRSSISSSPAFGRSVCAFEKLHKLKTISLHLQGFTCLHRRLRSVATRFVVASRRQHCVIYMSRAKTKAFGCTQRNMPQT